MIVLQILGWAVGGLITAWFAFCALVWIYWFLLGGKKGDHSGDATLGVVVLPIVPFVLGWEYIDRLRKR